MILWWRPLSLTTAWWITLLWFTGQKVLCVWCVASKERLFVCLFARVFEGKRAKVCVLSKLVNWTNINLTNDDECFTSYSHRNECIKWTRKIKFRSRKNHIYSHHFVHFRRANIFCVRKMAKLFHRLHADRRWARVYTQFRASSAFWNFFGFIMEFIC